MHHLLGARLVSIILTLERHLKQLVAWHVQLVRLATREDFLHFKEDALQASIALILKAQMCNRHAQKVISA